MQFCVKTFNELSNTELYNILKIRSEVFVVEQACVYNDMDGVDISSYHVFCVERGNITAYLRIIPEDDGKVKIGRVCSYEKRTGLGTLLLKEGIKASKEILGAEKIIVNAQNYIKNFYAKQGFVQTSGEFYEVGIPHVRMELDV